ncbi:MAG: fluoride efflux transporter FluC [Phycisphaerales bacterium]
MSGLLTVFLVFVAGGLGCVCRYGLVVLGARVSGWFPAGTLVANLVGCLLVGVLAPLLFGEEGVLPARWRVVVLVGFLGGFTTFASFAYDTLSMAESGRWWWAGLNFVGHTALGIGLVGLGAWVGRGLWGGGGAGG